VGDDGGADADADTDADAGPIVEDALAPCPPNTFPCGGTCVNLATDPANCGACGAVCGRTQTCIRATCQ
jgi:hypothetical protein